MGFRFKHPGVGFTRGEGERRAPHRSPQKQGRLQQTAESTWEGKGEGSPKGPGAAAQSKWTREWYCCRMLSTVFRGFAQQFYFPRRFPALAPSSCSLRHPRERRASVERRPENSRAGSSAGDRARAGGGVDGRTGNCGGKLRREIRIPSQLRRRSIVRQRRGGSVAREQALGFRNTSASYSKGPGSTMEAIMKDMDDLLASDLAAGHIIPTPPSEEKPAGRTLLPRDHRHRNWRIRDPGMGIGASRANP